MARFDRQIATAKRLIARNGMVCKWKQITKTAIPGSPFLTGSQSEQVYDAALCFVPASDLDYLIGTDVPATTVVALMGQVPFTPQLKDTVMRGTETLRVANIKPLAPNEQIILYAVVFE